MIQKNKIISLVMMVFFFTLIFSSSANATTASWSPSSPFVFGQSVTVTLTPSAGCQFGGSPSSSSLTLTDSLGATSTVTASSVSSTSMTFTFIFPSGQNGYWNYLFSVVETKGGGCGRNNFGGTVQAYQNSTLPIVPNSILITFLSLLVGVSLGAIIYKRRNLV